MMTLRNLISFFFAFARLNGGKTKNLARFISLLNGTNSDKSLKILLASSVGMNADQYFLNILGGALNNRNHEVSTIVCDGALKACFQCKHHHFSSISSQREMASKGPKLFCGVCQKKGIHYASASKSETLFFSDYLNDEELDNVDKKIEELTYLKEIENFTYRNYEVGKHAFSSAVRFFASPYLEKETMGLEVSKSYLKSAIRTVLVFETLFASTNFDRVILDHGIYCPQGIISEVANKFKIKQFCFATGYRKNSFLVSENQSYHFEIPKNKNYEKLSKDSNKIQIIKKYMESKRTGKEDWVLFQEISEEKFIPQVDQAKINIALFSNVLWDAKIHFDESIFEDPISWVKSTFEKSKDLENINFILRVHPGEQKGFVKSRVSFVDKLSESLGYDCNEKFQIIDSNNPINSYDLADYCDYSIVYGSKIGIELASLNKKVIVVGDCWTRQKGISIDPTSQKEYFEILRKINENDFDFKTNILNSLSFSYDLYFKKMVSLEFLKKSKGDPPFDISAEYLDRTHNLSDFVEFNDLINLIERKT